VNSSDRKYPIHPIIVALPIAFWLFSFLCDVIFGLRWGGALWKQIAHYTIAIGILFGIAAEIVSFHDYLPLDDRRLRRMDRKYISLQLIALILYLFNFASRFGNANYTVLPVLLSFTGVVLALIGGWFEAEIVHEYRLGGATWHEIGKDDALRRPQLPQKS
jgi:uncharacterized membrane protein